VSKIPEGNQIFLDAVTNALNFNHFYDETDLGSNGKYLQRKYSLNNAFEQK